MMAEAPTTTGQSTTTESLPNILSKSSSSHNAPTSVTATTTSPVNGNKGQSTVHRSRKEKLVLRSFSTEVDEMLEPRFLSQEECGGPRGSGKRGQRTRRVVSCPTSGSAPDEETVTAENEESLDPDIEIKVEPESFDEESQSTIKSPTASSPTKKARSFKKKQTSDQNSEAADESTPPTSPVKDSATVPQRRTPPATETNLSPKDKKRSKKLIKQEQRRKEYELLRQFKREREKELNAPKHVSPKKVKRRFKIKLHKEQARKKTNFSVEEHFKLRIRSYLANYLSNKNQGKHRNVLANANQEAYFEAINNLREFVEEVPEDNKIQLGLSDIYHGMLVDLINHLKPCQLDSGPSEQVKKSRRQGLFFEIHNALKGADDATQRSNRLYKFNAGCELSDISESKFPLISQDEVALALELIHPNTIFDCWEDDAIRAKLFLELFQNDLSLYRRQYQNIRNVKTFNYVHPNEENMKSVTVSMVPVSGHDGISDPNLVVTQGELGDILTKNKENYDELNTRRLRSGKMVPRKKLKLGKRKSSIRPYSLPKKNSFSLADKIDEKPEILSKDCDPAYSVSKNDICYKLRSGKHVPYCGAVQTELHPAVEMRIPQSSEDISSSEKGASDPVTSSSSPEIPSSPNSSDGARHSDNGKHFCRKLGFDNIIPFANGSMYTTEAPIKKHKRYTRKLHHKLCPAFDNSHCSHIPHFCAYPRTEGSRFCIQHVAEGSTSGFDTCAYIKGSRECGRYISKSQSQSLFCDLHALAIANARMKKLRGRKPSDKSRLLLKTLRLNLDRVQGKIMETDKDGSFKVRDELLNDDRDVLNLSSGSDDDDNRVGETRHNVDSDSDVEDIDWEPDENGMDYTLLRNAGYYSVIESVKLARGYLRKTIELYEREFQNLLRRYKSGYRTYLRKLRAMKSMKLSFTTNPKYLNKQKLPEDYVEQQVRSYNRTKAYMTSYKPRTHRTLLRDRLYKKRMELFEAEKKKPQGSNILSQESEFDGAYKVRKGRMQSRVEVGQCQYGRPGEEKCKENALSLTKYCKKHITEDKDQRLFMGCLYRYGPDTDDVCTTPILSEMEKFGCPLHNLPVPIKDQENEDNKLQIEELVKTVEDVKKSDSSDTEAEAENLKRQQLMREMEHLVADEIVDIDHFKDTVNQILQIGFRVSDTEESDDTEDEQ